MRVKDAVGRYGEQVAADFLSGQGLEILERNWRCRDGEIDVVARSGSTLVIVEVKTRSSVGYGLPAEAVDRRKAGRLRRLALLWIEQHRDAYPSWPAIRFDVLAVVRCPGRGPSITHIEGAF